MKIHEIINLTTNSQLNELFKINPKFQLDLDPKRKRGISYDIGPWQYSDKVKEYKTEFTIDIAPYIEPKLPRNQPIVNVIDQNPKKNDFNFEKWSKLFKQKSQIKYIVKLTKIKDYWYFGFAAMLPSAIKQFYGTYYGINYYQYLYIDALIDYSKIINNDGVRHISETLAQKIFELLQNFVNNPKHKKDKIFFSARTSEQQRIKFYTNLLSKFFKKMSITANENGDAVDFLIDLAKERGIGNENS